MDLSSLALFAGALFVAGASPGPAVAAILARVLARGTGGVVPFAAGIATGDVVWLTLAISGLAVLAHTFEYVFLVVRYLGAAYLLYLAYKLWTAPVGPMALGEARPAIDPWRTFAGGLALSLGNPKVVVFYLALLPTLLDLAAVSVTGWLELVAVVYAVLALIMGGYALTAARARRIFVSPRALRLVNRGSGTVMAGAAVAVVAR